MKFKRDLWSASSLTGAEIISTAIFVFSAPIILRAYRVEEFGMYDLYFGLMMLASVVGMLGYENTLFFQKNREEEVDSFVLACLTSIVINALFVVIIMLLRLSHFLPQASENWIWAVPVGAFLSNMYSLFSIWIIKWGDFGVIARCRIFGAIVTLLSQLLWSLSGLGHIALICSNLVGQFLVVAFLTIFCFVKANVHLRCFDPRRSLALANQNWRMPILALPGNFLANLGQSLPSFFFALISDQLVGHYFLAKRLLGTPMKAASAALRPLYQSSLSAEIASHGSARNTYARHMIYYSTIGALALILTLVLSPYAIPNIFGEQWAESILFVQIFSIGFCFNFVFGGLSAIMVYGRLPGFDVCWQIGSTVVLLITLSGSYATGCSPITMAANFTTVQALLYSVYGYIGYRSSKSARHLTLSGKESTS